MRSDSAAVDVIAPGLLTTVQDLGRHGYQRYGIPVCGALDTVSLRIANIMAGNEEGSAGLEITLTGPSLRFGFDTVIAVTGADFAPKIDGQEIPSWESAAVRAGSVLSFDSAQDGMRAYLAIAGGVDVTPVMGSRSTDLKGGFGGLNGRALRAGDIIPIGPIGVDAVSSVPAGRGMPIEISREPTREQSFQIRVILGPQHEEFTQRGIRRLLSSRYRVSADSDRMGCRLEGGKIEHVHGPDIVSDGTALGSIQVPGSGRPIVLLADRGTTGGYTKAATVISADIGLLAQAAPGATVRFSEVSIEQARDIYLDMEAMITEIEAYIGR